MSTHRQRQPRKSLTEERLRHSWSQQELAERLGTTPENVSRWERGVTSPGPYYRQRLCDLFQKSSEELGLFIEAGSTPEGEEANSTLSEPAPPLPLAVSSTQNSSRSGPFSRSLLIRGTLLLGVVLLLAGAGFSFFYRPASSVPSHIGKIATPTLPRNWHQTLNDPLTIAHHGPDWYFDGKTCFYNAQAYEEIDTGLNYCNDSDETEFPFHNLVYSLDVAIYKGDYAGLIFRLDHNHNYYYFSLKTTGMYELIRHDDANGGHNIFLAGSSSPFIRQGLRQWNTLTVFAQDSTFQLWVNGHYLTTVSDKALTLGTIAVAVSIGGENIETNGWFRNAHVWQP